MLQRQKSRYNEDIFLQILKFTSKESEHSQQPSYFMHLVCIFKTSTEIIKVMSLTAIFKIGQKASMEMFHCNDL